MVSSQQKHNARNQFYALRALRFLCACISVFLSVSHEQRALRPLRCIRQLGTELKSVFIGLCAVSRLSYATHANNGHTKYRMHARKKHNAHSQFYSLHCVFCVHTLRALHPLRCIRHLGNRPFKCCGSVSTFRACTSTLDS